MWSRDGRREGAWQKVEKGVTRPFLVVFLVVFLLPASSHSGPCPTAARPAPTCAPSTRLRSTVPAPAVTTPDLKAPAVYSMYE